MLLLIFIATSTVQGQQSAFRYELTEFQSFFPDGVLARLSVVPMTRLSSATFFLTMDGSTIYTKTLEVPVHEPGERVSLLATWDGFVVEGQPTPPWARLQIWWLLVDENGNSINTPPLREIYTDARRDWDVQEGAYISVYTYQQPPDLAQLAVQLGDEAMMRLRDTYGYSLSYRPILIFYNSPEDGAVDLGHTRWEPFAGHIAGRAYPGTNVMIALANQGEDFVRRAVPHELAHLYQFQMGALLFDAPLWWIEGDARAQELPDATLLRQQIREAGEQLPYLPTWIPTQADDGLLISNLGASFVLFLTETYGWEAYRQFYQNWLASEDFYQAFKATYDISLAQLDLEWRAWIYFP